MTSPSSHGRTSSGPAPSTGGRVVEQLLPAEHRAVAERGEGGRPGQEGTRPVGAQAERPAEQHEDDDGQHDGGDDRPPQHLRHVGQQQPGDHADQAHHQERVAGVRRRERAQGDRRQREQQGLVDQRAAGRQPRAPRRDRGAGGRGGHGGAGGRPGGRPGDRPGAGLGGGHRTLQRSSPARSSLVASRSTDTPPASVTPAVVCGSTTIADPAYLGGERRPGAQQRLDGGSGAGQEHQQARVAGHLRCPVGGADQPESAQAGAADGVEREVALHPRRHVRAAHERRLELVDRCPHDDRGGHRHGGLEGGVADGALAPGGRRVVDDDRGVAAPGVEVLPHQQLALAGRGHRLRGGAPVHVAQVVAGGVLAQGVEGEVALRHGIGRDALEVAQQPGPQRLERHQRRPDQDLVHLAPA